MLTYELIPFENGSFGYRVLLDGVAVISQKYEPRVGGRNFMTGEVATSSAQYDIEQLAPILDA